MFDIIFVSLSIIIGSLFNTEMDKIKFKPEFSLFPKSNFWVKNNPTKNWFLRAPLSMFADGWHLCKFFMKIFYFIPIGYLWKGFSWEAVLIVTALYILQGVEHEIMYYIKFRSN